MSTEKVESTRGQTFTKAWFSWGIPIAVGLAFLAPEFGGKRGPLHPEILVRSGIVFVFLLHGLRLPFDALARGLVAWKAHCLVQGIGFVLMPACGWIAMHALWGRLSEPLLVGVLYLSALPTTVASAVVLVGVARGNVALAIFDAALSGLLAVVVTPTWMALATRSAVGLANVEGMILPLFLMLVAPVLVGQIVRGVFTRFVSRRMATSWSAPAVATVAGFLDRLVVLFIVYTVFCDAFLTSVFTQIRPHEIALVTFVCAVLLALALGASRLLGRSFGIAPSDQIAVAFCAATKSLAVGVPMALVIFPRSPDVALLLLPIMLYHPLQLIVLGAVSTRLRGRVD